MLHFSFILLIACKDLLSPHLTPQQGFVLNTIEDSGGPSPQLAFQYFHFWDLSSMVYGYVYHGSEYVYGHEQQCVHDKRCVHGLHQGFIVDFTKDKFMDFINGQAFGFHLLNDCEVKQMTTDTVHNLTSF